MARTPSEQYAAEYENAVAMREMGFKLAQSERKTVSKLGFWLAERGEQNRREAIVQSWRKRR